ncbi:MAG TPA: hypothetical protein VJC03_02755, partial [bacterium]|nr:hypothetical protein [bacterium]
MKKPKIRLILATAALFRLFTVTAFSLELSLEENRGEKGSVGYVDIERVFKESPETLRAKDDFQSQIQKKEKLLNEKKSALFALKADLSRLKQEREFAARLPMLTEPSPAPPVPEPAGISTSAIMTELSASSPSAAAQTESVMTPSQSAEISTAAIMTELLASSHTTAQAESVIAPGAPPVASQP